MYDSNGRELSPLRKNVKVAIGIPCYSGRVVVETIASLLSMVQYHALKFPHHKVDTHFRVRNFCTYAAEKLCEMAMESYDYLLFCGDDIVAPHDAIERLLSHDKDMVASLVYARGEPFAMYAYGDDGFQMNRKMRGTGLQKVSAAGTGLMLIKTSVLSKMKKPLWIWPNEHETDPDKFFCDRAREEAGASIYVDTDLEVGHLDFTPNVIDHKTHDEYIESLKASGIMDRPEIKAHKDYKKLEVLVHG